MYGKGFDLHGELLDLGCDVGLLSKSGAWWVFLVLYRAILLFRAQPWSIYPAQCS